MLLPRRQVLNGGRLTLSVHKIPFLEFSPVVPDRVSGPRVIRNIRKKIHPNTKTQENCNAYTSIYR
jgi:hypothetical protein